MRTGEGGVAKDTSTLNGVQVSEVMEDAKPEGCVVKPPKRDGRPSGQPRVLDLSVCVCV